jgi:hypothetical protein
MSRYYQCIAKCNENQNIIDHMLKIKISEPSMYDQRLVRNARTRLAYWKKKLQEATSTLCIVSNNRSNVGNNTSNVLYGVGNNVLYGVGSNVSYGVGSNVLYGVGSNVLYGARNNIVGSKRNDMGVSKNKIIDDNEERTVLDWWKFEFGENYRKMAIGHLSERIEVDNILGRHTVEYFLPQDFVVANKITTYKKWKENLPILHNLSRKVTMEYRVGKIVEPLVFTPQKENKEITLMKDVVPINKEIMIPTNKEIMILTNKEIIKDVIPTNKEITKDVIPTNKEIMVPTNKKIIKDVVPTNKETIKDMVPTNKKIIKDVIPINEETIKDMVPISTNKEIIKDAILTENQIPVDIKDVILSEVLFPTSTNKIASIFNKNNYSIKSNISTVLYHETINTYITAAAA